MHHRRLPLLVLGPLFALLTAACDFDARVSLPIAGGTTVHVTYRSGSSPPAAAKTRP